MLAQKAIILSWTLSLLLVMSPPVQAGDEVVHKDEISFAFYGDTIHLQPNHWQFVPLEGKISEASIQVFYDKMDAGHYQDIVAELLAYKEKNHLNDWFYYQLIRKTVQAISPKAENYEQYTLYKWFFMAKSGYDARLALFRDELLFYVQSDENIYDIPYYIRDGKQYICLNYHDYGRINFEEDELRAVNTLVPEGRHAFSYKVTLMPDFTPDNYKEKELQFTYHNKSYFFKVMLNPDIPNIFINYPVVDYESYFNIPLSKKTYNSLIPMLKKVVQGMKQGKGVDYLMEFTRNAFLYENDEEHFGKEKRLSPEQTLLYDHSDCDDRAALFFYLVKEIYNLPMIVLLYPTHVTIAVKFDKPIGNPIVYKNNLYSVCEPTPQRDDLRIGEVSPELKNVPYQVAYEYNPLPAQ
jgi:hypothetical protein